MLLCTSAKTSEMTKNKKNLNLSDLGEFGLIDHLTRDFPVRQESTLKAVGDDAAVLNHSGREIVVTTDLLVEGIHFNLIYTPLKHLGYKAVAANISDICAMNCEPLQVFVSLAFSSKFTLGHLEELYEGIRLACDFYKVDLAGGDTSTSMTGLNISITAIGQGDRNTITYRSGAKTGDLICVSGDLGASYLGLQLLEREKTIYLRDQTVQPKLEGYDHVLQRQLRPDARVDVVRLLKEKGLVPTSMIDISDGLSSEILHICRQSAVGCRIHADKIPVHAESRKVANELNLEPAMAALNGGEDYELLFTVDQKNYPVAAALPGISIIGHIIPEAEGRHLVLSDGTTTEIHAMGWNAVR